MGLVRNGSIPSQHFEKIFGQIKKVGVNFKLYDFERKHLLCHRLTTLMLQKQE